MSTLILSRIGCGTVVYVAFSLFETLLQTAFSAILPTGKDITSYTFRFFFQACICVAYFLICLLSPNSQ